MSHRDTPRSHKRQVKDPREYLVKWSGYDEFEATWEPETNVRLLDAFKSYWRANAQAPEDHRRRRRCGARAQPCTLRRRSCLRRTPRRLQQPVVSSQPRMSSSSGLPPASSPT
eukprot:87251-Chlamydomonas_euryale.AAC.1